VSLLLALPSVAQAFCGFYVGGADQGLYNDATLVVLLRSGTKTVLSMQNNYQGPPEGFAMVVPVPQVLQKDNVRILPKDVFAHVDALAAPRLVEYWEEDPCQPRYEEEWKMRSGAIPMAPMMEGAAPGNFGVKIEARFEVGEYDVVILSAQDSNGLEGWLHHEKYAIPTGAATALRPYVESGTKFFVAKVIPQKVKFEGDRAVLSPLRVHYDAETFSLPVRLGLLNSRGTQDLLVHVLAPGGQRYEVANYANAFVPTNLRVKNAVRENFGGFYEAVFSEVSRPGTVVTEYSWDAGSCDPCPTPPLDDAEIATLGGDVVGDSSAYSYTLTRMHYRYGTDGLKEDLVFRAAPPVMGGRGVPDAQGRLDTSVQRDSGVNNFQGRYVILHPWEGKVTCENPQRGSWGGPPNGVAQTETAKSRLTTGAAAAPARVSLASVVEDGLPSVAPAPSGIPEMGGGPAGIPELGGGPAPAPVAEDEPDESRCQTAPGAAWLAVVGLLALRRRR
jgi:hypothetical protein